VSYTDFFECICRHALHHVAGIQLDEARGSTSVPWKSAAFVDKTYNTVI